MKLRILHVGRAAGDILPALEEYIRRIGHYMDIQRIPVRPARHLPAKKAIEAEGENLLSAAEDGSKLVALSEDGSYYNSRGFAKFLGKFRRESRSVAFLIAGAHGHSKAVKERAEFVLSLSPMTMQHDIALLVLAEQIYRAMTIISGENYHK